MNKSYEKIKTFDINMLKLDYKLISLNMKYIIFNLSILYNLGQSITNIILLI